MQPFIRTVRAAAWATLWLLFPGLLWAQGTSPWVEAVNELQAQFTGPIARGLTPGSRALRGLRRFQSPSKTLTWGSAPGRLAARTRAASAASYM